MIWDLAPSALHRRDVVLSDSPMTWDVAPSALIRRDVVIGDSPMTWNVAPSALHRRDVVLDYSARPSIPTIAPLDFQQLVVVLNNNRLIGKGAAVDLQGAGEISKANT